MDLKGFDLEHWWKMLAGAGALLAIASAPGAFAPGLLIGLGLLFVGIGEWINHPYREQMMGGGWKASGHPRDPSPAGVILDLAGGALAVVGLITLAFR